MTITREELTLKSAHDGLELGVSIRFPDHPRGILQLVHGMAEHRERYHDFMDFCAQHGLVVIIHDHRGHGASVKSPEDYGYFYQDGAKGVVDDAHQITQYIRKRFPGLPLTLLGHSMGSLIVRAYMRQYDMDVDGLIVCGSPSKRVGARTGLAIVKFLKVVRGERHRSSLVNALSFGGYNRKSAKLARQNSNTDAAGTYTHENSWVVSDPAVVEAYDADPRDGFRFTLNGFEVLFTLVSQAYHKTGWKLSNPNVPIFFISGADDPCLISHKDFYKAVDFMRQRGYHHVSSKLYPKMRHEILNEVGKAEVWQDIITWIDREVIK